MLDVAPTELLLVAIVALLVIGPKDLPKAMRFVGKWVGKARGVARQFRSGFDTMVREAELEEMEKKWAEENARIMREHPIDLSTAPQSALAAPKEAFAVDAETLSPDANAPSHQEQDGSRDAVFGTVDGVRYEEPVMVEKPVVEPADPPFDSSEPDGSNHSAPPAPTSDKASS